MADGFHRVRDHQRGIYRIHDVVDYASKYCLASIARPTGTATDAIDAVHAAIVEARRVMGLPLIVDCYDEDTDLWHRCGS